MKIERIEVFVVKIDRHDRFGGQTAPPETLGGSDYYFEAEWKEIYATKIQSVLVCLTTDSGLEAWGEGQAPIVPEAAASVVRHLLAPVLLGEDPLRHEWLHQRLIGTMRNRGQVAGFMLDAVAAVDNALWDLKGRHYGAPVAELLGGPHRRRLDAYVSALRAPTVEERVKVAVEHLRHGFAGVKAYLGRGVRADVAEVDALRQGVGPGARLEADCFWLYDLADAIRVGRALDRCSFEWMEAPMDPQDVAGHARLARSIDTRVAVGEPIRSAEVFLPWFQAGAIGLAQPDVARIGITESKKIADLAALFGLNVGFHVGVCLGIGMAATWQLAAAVGNFQIQEHEPVIMEPSNAFLDPPLREEGGTLVVPEAPGLGVAVNRVALMPHVAEHHVIAA
jgi:L-alanine-DL-glutamate epimerase-like enolase superfamily enzyme